MVGSAEKKPMIREKEKEEAIRQKNIKIKDFGILKSFQNRLNYTICCAFILLFY